MKESKKHHYNPKSILRRFSNSDNSVFILNKATKTVFTNSIENTGSENYFNTIRVDGNKRNFEKLFDKLDGRLASLVSKIVDEKSLQDFTVKELEDLAVVVAVQYIRTKITRTEAQDFTKKANQFTLDSALQMQATPALYPELNDEEIKITTIINLSHIEEVQNELLNKDIALIDCTNSENKFITSDNPVVLGTSLDYGQIGLKEKGVEIYYPISPNLCIGYYCKSIRKTLSLIRNTCANVDKLINVLENKATIKYSNTNVNHLNHLQLINSSQFLYSSNDNFQTQKTFLAQNPRYGKVESRFGELSNDNAQLEFFPLGDFVVFIMKEKSFKISVYDIESEIDFSFKTDELEKFHLFTTGDQLESIIYYSDKVQTSIMNEIEIMEVKNNRITIGLKNRGLADAIIQMKNRKKNCD